VALTRTTKHIIAGKWRLGVGPAHPPRCSSWQLVSIWSLHSIQWSIERWNLRPEWLTWWLRETCEWSSGPRSVCHHCHDNINASESMIGLAIASLETKHLPASLANSPVIISATLRFEYHQYCKHWSLSGPTKFLPHRRYLAPSCRHLPFLAHMFSCSESQHLVVSQPNVVAGKVPDIVIIHISPLITWNHRSRVILLLIIMVPFIMFYITSWRGQVALTLQPINSLERVRCYFERQILFFEFGNISRTAAHEFTEP